MKRILLLLSLVLVGISLPLADAEAKRLGGGRSIGMQRDMSAARPAAPPAQQQIAPAYQSAPGAAPMPAAQPKRNWVGPLAGLAAGLGLGALLAGSGFGGMLDNLFTVLLLVLAAVFIMRLVSAFRRQPKPEEPLQYAGVGGPGMAPIPEIPQSPLSGAAPANISQPAGFDAESFLRVAKVNYIRLQAAYDTANLDDLREFTSPELFAEIKLDLTERGAAQQKTDVVTLDAELLDVTTQGNQHVASVRFHGLIREEEQGGAQPVDEMWHLAKSVDGSRGWVVAGIQQK